MNKKYLQWGGRDHRSQTRFPCTPHVLTHNLWHIAFQYDVSGWNFKVVVVKWLIASCRKIVFSVSARSVSGSVSFVSGTGHKEAAITTQYKYSIGCLLGSEKFAEGFGHCACTWCHRRQAPKENIHPTVQSPYCPNRAIAGYTRR